MREGKWMEGRGREAEENGNCRASDRAVLDFK